MSTRQHMPLGILIATLLIVVILQGGATTDTPVIFDLTDCVTSFVKAKLPRREVVSLNLSAAASFQEIIEGGKKPFKIEVRNITYGNKVHTSISEDSTNYSTDLKNDDYIRTQQKTYAGDVLAPIAAIWTLRFAFQTEFDLPISTQPPKAYNGSQELEYKFHLNNVLKLERKGWTHLIRNKTFNVKPRKVTRVTLTVREATKTRSFSADVVLIGYFGVKITPRGDEPSSRVFGVTELQCAYLEKTAQEEMTFRVNGTFQEQYPVSKITLTTHDLPASEEETEVPALRNQSPPEEEVL